ncbi:MAG: DUF1830 domain-containing protein [Synechococcales bacterium]|nr:DUF1830 domain-containing protein [Synechococcales bacterium]
MTETNDLDLASTGDPSQPGRFLPCCYINQSDAVQMIKIKNGTNLVLERMVAPGGQILFYSVLDGLIEVYSSDGASDSPLEIIPCSTLTTVD